MLRYIFEVDIAKVQKRLEIGNTKSEFVSGNIYDGFANDDMH
jgi:hypothetical protein